MKAIILAAGYATRLYPLTKKIAKPLLPIGTRLMLDYVVERLRKLSSLQAVYVVTNQTFFAQFQEWKKRNRQGGSIHLVNDGTRAPEERLGAIRDLQFVIRKKKMKEDLIVAGGDNFFDFELGNFVTEGKKHRPYPTLGVYNIGSQIEAKRFGVVQLNTVGKIANFMEKPDQPHSTFVAMCLYYFPKESLSWIKEYLDFGENADAPGHYLSWLVKQKQVYGCLFEGEWVDIGDLKTYRAVQKKYQKPRSGANG